MVNTAEIEQLAYELWEQDGRQHGRDAEYYFTAERMLAERDGAVAVAEAPKKRTRAAASPDKPKVTRTRTKKAA